MKSQNRISQLTLELYYRGLATRKERKLVEKAFATDSEVLKRYEALQKSEREIRQLVTQELIRLNIPESPPAPQKRKAASLLLVAAVLLLCALVPAILYLKSGGSTKDNPVAEEATREINTENGTEFIEEEPNREIAVPSEQPGGKDDGSPRTEPDKPEIAESPRVDPEHSAEARESRGSPPDSGVSVATVPPSDTGVQLRGGGEAGQPGTTADQSEPSNINIPPGITFIFDGMFANKGLTFVIIPARITAIGKNAFLGNPLVSVTLGANVSIEDNAIPGNFAAEYNASGKTAGTYTRTDVNSEAWRKK